MISIGIFAVALIAFGVLLIIKPKLVAEHLERFYKRYPIIRSAPSKQFAIRASLIIILGIVIVLIGVMALIG